MKKGKQFIYNCMRFFKLLPFFNAISTFKILQSDFGHFMSSYHSKPIDKNQKEIPWFTYPAIEYLNKLDLKDKSIFEYGSGNSTVYWTRNMKEVFAVENNETWFKSVKKRIKNAKYQLETDKDKYINNIKVYKRKYDVIVIDGDFRDKCAIEAIKYLGEGGFIVLDNSDWFPKICEFLRTNNLIEVGLGRQQSS